jgi:hypothetical protein
MAVMFEVAVPGERWEIEFYEDGNVEEYSGAAESRTVRRSSSGCFPPA